MLMRFYIQLSRSFAIRRLVARVESNNHWYISWSSHVNTNVVRDQTSCNEERQCMWVMEWYYTSYRVLNVSWHVCQHTASVLCLILLRYSKLQSCAEMHICVIMLCFTAIYNKKVCCCKQNVLLCK